MKASQQLRQTNRDLLSWLTWTNVLMSVLLLVAVIGTITGPTLGSLFNLYDISLGFVVIILCANLLSNPKILYGIHAPFTDDSENKPDEKIDETNTPTSEYVILAADATRYRKVLLDYFQGSNHYLSADFSLQSLSTDTGIPKHVLSQFINREFGMGFREYLNHYRIKYMIDHFDQPEWSNYTLEAKSRECGFNSRKTFIDHFKKTTGKLPKAYFNS
jgi:AraC-like DNA-binding protein